MGSWAKELSAHHVFESRTRFASCHLFILNGVFSQGQNLPINEMWVAGPCTWMMVIDNLLLLNVPVLLRSIPMLGSGYIPAHIFLCVIWEPMRPFGQFTFLVRLLSYPGKPAKFRFIPFPYLHLRILQWEISEMLHSWLSVMVRSRNRQE